MIYHLHQARRSMTNVGYGLLEISVARDKICLHHGRADRGYLDDKTRRQALGVAASLRMCLYLESLTDGTLTSQARNRLDPPD